MRGPQSALFGRNTLGGAGEHHQHRPSLKNWTDRSTARSAISAPVDLQGTASGPVARPLAIGVGAGYTGRDGLYRQHADRNDLDSRSAFFSKTQILWAPAGVGRSRHRHDRAGARRRLRAERPGTLRAVPLRVARDFEGFTHRDIVAPTLLVTRAGNTIDFSSTTGFVWWKTDDLTDLDYTPLPLIRRANTEDNRQFTQEFRVASSSNASRALSRSRHVAVAGGPVPLLAGVHAGRGELVLAVRAVAVSAVCGRSAFAACGARRSRRRPLRPRHIHVQRAPRRGDRRSARITRTRRPNLNTFFSPAIAPPNAVDGRAQLQRRVAAVHAFVSASTEQHRVRHRLERLQGGRLQCRVAAGQRVLRRRAQLELRGRREDVVACAQRLSVNAAALLHRLDGSSGQRARTRSCRLSSTSPMQAPQRARASRSS